MASDERVEREGIEERYPDLIDGLLAHPGVGVVIVHSAANGPVALGRTGEHYLASGRIVGEDPLEAFGPRAAESPAPPRWVHERGRPRDHRAVRRRLGEVTSYEDLVGSHGGLGGRQQEPFLLHPVDLPIGDAPLVGAPAVHEVLRAGWRRCRPVGRSRHPGRRSITTGRRRRTGDLVRQRASRSRRLSEPTD